MFRGISSLNLDAKGRLAMPTKYREQLVAACNSELVITVDKDHCLLIYPKPVWIEIEETLRSLPSFNETTRFLQRLYIGNAHEIEMDSQGRVRLPPELRRFADLNKKVALVGQINKFELWDEATWNSRQEAQLAQVDINKLDLPEEFKSLSI